MTRHYVTHTVFLAGMLLVSGGLARADDVTRCIDERGAVTYTNLPCSNGSVGMQDADPDKPATAKAAIALPADTFAAVGEIHEGEWARKQVRSRSEALDVETMKAARSSLLAMDQASHWSGRQELVALDQRNRDWFDFR